MAENDDQELEPTDARQARPVKGMPGVLVISIALALVLIAVAFALTLFGN